MNALEQAKVIVSQLGRNNLLAISGGRVTYRETGITLPVSYGYSVTIDLENDLYIVRRVFKRGGKVTIKGEVKGVYCDDLGEIAYQAHAYKSYEFPKIAPSTGFKNPFKSPEYLEWRTRRGLEVA